MKTLPSGHSTTARTRLRTLLSCLLMLGIQPSIAQQFEFSTGPVTGEWSRGASTWDGKHTFLNIYCAQFPQPRMVKSTSEGLLNHNAISFFRVVYKDTGLAAFIVTSTVPAGRTDNDELQRLLVAERQQASAVAEVSPDVMRYRVATQESQWGTMIRMHMFNVSERPGQDIFPLAKPLLAQADAPPHSQSAHRLFVHRANRFEIAVLGFQDDPDQEGSAAKLDARLEAFADEIATSLQQCTSSLEAVGAAPVTSGQAATVPTATGTAD